MSDLRLEARELYQLADSQEDAADAADQGNKQSSEHFSNKLWETHGVISGPSNNAFAKKAKQREELIQSMQQACNTIAAGLRSAAASYLCTDEISAVDLSQQC